MSTAPRSRRGSRCSARSRSASRSQEGAELVDLARAGRAAARLRARHVSRCRAPDLSGGHRSRRHRRAARGERVHALAGTRALAPEPVDLLRARRRAALRHGSRTTSPRSCSCSDPRAASSAMGRKAREQREITSEPLAGQMIDVEVPTHVSSAIEFASGAIATLVTSFDVQASRYRCIEVYGIGSHAVGARPEHLRRPGVDQAPRRRGVDRGRAARARTCRSSAASASPTCSGRSAPAVRTARRPSSRSTCSSS